MRQATVWVLGWLSLTALGAAPALAADEVFIHRGWKAYRVDGAEMGGCRMTKRVNGSMHLLAHVTANGTFLIGFVDTNMRVRPGTDFTGGATFDGTFFSLRGSADNTQVVTFGSDDPRLEEAFQASQRVYMTWSGNGWIRMGLSGTRRATQLLRRCALPARPRSGYVTSYAPTPQPRAVGTMFDTDLPGNDYLYVDALSQGQCIAACQGDRVCRAITYNLQKGRCFFKHSVGRGVRFYGATSWVK